MSEDTEVERTGFSIPFPLGDSSEKYRALFDGMMGRNQGVSQTYENALLAKAMLAAGGGAKNSYDVLEHAAISLMVVNEFIRGMDDTIMDKFEEHCRKYPDLQIPVHAKATPYLSPVNFCLSPAVITISLQHVMDCLLTLLHTKSAPEDALNIRWKKGRTPPPKTAYMETVYEKKAEELTLAACVEAVRMLSEQTMGKPITLEIACAAVSKAHEMGDREASIKGWYIKWRKNHPDHLKTVAESIISDDDDIAARERLVSALQGAAQLIELS